MSEKRCKFPHYNNSNWNCGSYAFNLQDQTGEDQGDYCDVHYWQHRCEKVEGEQQLRREKIPLLSTEPKPDRPPDVYWQPIATAPHGVKIQMLSKGGIAIYGSYHGGEFWIGWYPLPKRPKEMK